MEVMDLAARDGGMAMVHAENGCCKAYLEGVAAGAGEGLAAQAGLPQRPNILESEAVNRAATMAVVTRFCPLSRCT